jgi:hypothetical protein
MSKADLEELADLLDNDTSGLRVVAGADLEDSVAGAIRVAEATRCQKSTPLGWSFGIRDELRAHGASGWRSWEASFGSLFATGRVIGLM